MTDHDQRFKTLLQCFLPQFFELFFPEWAARFDFNTVELLDTEVFPDPPEGSRRSLDLVARLHATQPITDEEGHLAEEWLSLIHIEVESADSVKPLRRRMHWYYANLRQKHELPVLPIALYLNVGLEGVGLDEYREDYSSLPVLHFRYLYVGLPRLDAVEYVERGVPLGAALASLMKFPRDRRSWLTDEAKQRIAAAGLNEYLTFLLAECLEAYLDLTPDEVVEVEGLLQQHKYQEARQMGVTTFERGVLKGEEKGRQEGRQEGFELGLRRAIAMQLERRFAPVPEGAMARLDQMREQELEELLARVMDAASLDDLGLSGNE